MSIYLIDDKKVDASEAFDSRLQGPSESFTSVTDSKSNHPKIYKEMHETIIHNGKVVKDVNMIQTDENIQINGIVNGQKIAMSIDNPSKETSSKVIPTKETSSNDSALRTTRKFRNNHVKFSDSIATPMNHIHRIATPYNNGVAVSKNTNKKSNKNAKKKSSKNTKKKSIKKRITVKK